MPLKNLAPYLTFDGTAQQALELYERALGAQRKDVRMMRDVPGMELGESDRGRLMHAHVTVDGRDLMLADSMPNMPGTKAGNVSVCLNFTDLQEMTTKFTALAKGGKVACELQDTPWSAKFGVLTDAYGIEWMFNCEQAAAAE